MLVLNKLSQENSDQIYTLTERIRRYVQIKYYTGYSQRTKSRRNMIFKLVLNGANLLYKSLVQTENAPNLGQT